MLGSILEEKEEKGNKMKDIQKRERERENMIPKQCLRQEKRKKEKMKIYRREREYGIPSQCLRYEEKEG